MSFSEEIDFTNKINLTQEYSIELEDEIEPNCIITESGKLFCVSLEAQNIYVIDLNDGKILKSFKIEGEYRKYNTVKEKNVIYMIFDEKYLYKINSEKLELMDIFYDNLGRYFSKNIMIYNDTMITSDEIGNISSVDLKNGKIISHRDIHKLRYVNLYDDTLFFTTAGYNVYALEPKTLDLIWKYEEKKDRGSANIAYKDGEIYFNNYDTTKVFDSKTGVLISDFPHNGSTLVIVEDTLYSRLHGKRVFAVDLNTENVIWEKNINTNLLIVQDNVFVKDKNKYIFKKLNKDNGNLIWETNWDNEYVVDIFEIDKYYVVDTGHEAIYLVDKYTGEKLWKYSSRIIRKGIFRSKNELYWAVYDNFLILSEGDDKIKVYDINTK